MPKRPTLLELDNRYRKICKVQELFWGVKFPLAKRPTHTWERLGLAADMRNANHSWREIEETVGMTKCTLTLLFRKWFPELIDYQETRPARDPEFVLKVFKLIAVGYSDRQIAAILKSTRGNISGIRRDLKSKAQTRVKQISKIS